MRFVIDHGGAHPTRDTYSVLHVFPTKADADGPLPKDLLRLIRRGGGAAFVELNAHKGLRADGDMMIGPGHSRPRYYVLALGTDGQRDGYPVALKKTQLERIRRYLRQ